MTNKRGKAQTVLGLINSREFGPTLAHDHLMIDTRWLFREPDEASLKALAYQKITLQNFGWINYNWINNSDNCSVPDENVVIAEVKRFAGAGGRTIVDPTNVGLGRDPLALARISRLTGINLIMGAGLYLEKTLPAEYAKKSEEAITQEIMREFEVGVGDTGIRPGLIGEIGCGYPMTEIERKSLRAAVHAQIQTGAALMVHPGRDPNAPFEIIETVRAAGGDLNRTVICHIDRTCVDRGWLAELASTGVYIEYDLFGNETSYYCQNPKVDMPSDAQRIDLLLWHVEHGTHRKVLISHDIATKTRLSHYGGLGFDHILTNIVPRLRRRGLGQEQISHFVIDNPATIFSFV